MSAMTYLWRHPKSGVYYFRRAVPAELRSIVGKTMIKQSLGTKDVAAAKRQVLSLALRTEKQFVAAKEKSATPPLTELSDREIDLMAANYLHARLADDEAQRVQGSKEDDDLYKALKRQVEEAIGAPSRFSDAEATAEIGLSDRFYQKKAETLEIVLPALKEGLARGDTSLVADDVDDFLEIHGVKLDPSSAAYRRLSFEFLKIAVKATEAIAKRHQGEVIETPAAPTLPIAARSTVAARDGMDLMSMFQGWLTERNPPIKTVLDFSTAIRRFTELHGNLPVLQITKSHVRAYKDAVTGSALMFRQDAQDDLAAPSGVPGGASRAFEHDLDAWLHQQGRGCSPDRVSLGRAPGLPRRPSKLVQPRRQHEDPQPG